MSVAFVAQLAMMIPRMKVSAEAGSMVPVMAIPLVLIGAARAISSAFRGVKAGPSVGSSWHGSPTATG